MRKFLFINAYTTDFWFILGPLLSSILTYSLPEDHTFFFYTLGILMKIIIESFNTGYMINLNLSLSIFMQPAFCFSATKWELRLFFFKWIFCNIIKFFCMYSPIVSAIIWTDMWCFPVFPHFLNQMFPLKKNAKLIKICHL